MEEEGSTAKMVMAQNPEQGPQVPAAQSRCVRAKLTSIMEVPGDPAPGIHSCPLLSPPAFLGLA